MHYIVQLVKGVPHSFPSFGPSAAAWSLDVFPLAVVSAYILSTLIRWANKRLRRALGRKDDASSRRRRLFSVFVSREDILESYQVRVPPEAIEQDERAAANVVYSAPGIELSLIPLVELFLRANATAETLNTAQDWTEAVPRAALTLTWVRRSSLRISCAQLTFD